LFIDHKFTDEDQKSTEADSSPQALFLSAPTGTLDFLSFNLAHIMTPATVSQDAWQQKI